MGSAALTSAAACFKFDEVMLLLPLHIFRWRRVSESQGMASKRDKSCIALVHVKGPIPARGSSALYSSSLLAVPARLSSSARCSSLHWCPIARVSALHHMMMSHECAAVPVPCYACQMRVSSTTMHTCSASRSSVLALYPSPQACKPLAPALNSWAGVGKAPAPSLSHRAAFMAMVRPHLDHMDCLASCQVCSCCMTHVLHRALGLNVRACMGSDSSPAVAQRDALHQVLPKTGRAEHVPKLCCPGLVVESMELLRHLLVLGSQAQHALDLRLRMSCCWQMDDSSTSASHLHSHLQCEGVLHPRSQGGCCCDAQLLT